MEQNADDVIIISDDDPAECLQIFKNEDDYDETVEINSANASTFISTDEIDVFEIFQYDDEDDELNNWPQNDAPVPMQTELLEEQTGLKGIEITSSENGQLNKKERKCSQLPTLEAQSLSQQNLYCEENVCNCKTFLPDEITNMHSTFSSWSYLSQQRYLQSRICIESTSNNIQSTVKFYLPNSENASMEVCQHFFKSVYRLATNRLAELIRKACEKNNKFTTNKRLCADKLCGCRKFSLMEIEILQKQYRAIGASMRTKVMLTQLCYLSNTDRFTYFLTHPNGSKREVCKCLFSFIYEEPCLDSYLVAVRTQELNLLGKRKAHKINGHVIPLDIGSKKKKMEESSPSAIKECVAHCRCLALTKEEREKYFEELKELSKTAIIRLLSERVLWDANAIDILKDKFQYFLPANGKLMRVCANSFQSIYRLTTFQTNELHKLAKRDIYCCHKLNSTCEFRSIPPNKLANLYNNRKELNNLKRLVRYECIHRARPFKFFLPYEERLIQVCEKIFARVLHFERSKIHSIIKDCILCDKAKESKTASRINKKKPHATMYPQTVNSVPKLSELTCSEDVTKCKCPQLAKHELEALEHELSQKTSKSEKYDFICKGMIFQEMETKQSVALSYLLKFYAHQQTTPICRRYFSKLYKITNTTLLSLIKVAFGNKTRACKIPGCSCLCISKSELVRNVDLYQNLDKTSKLKFLLSLIKYMPPDLETGVFKDFNKSPEDYFKYYLFSKNLQPIEVCVYKFCKVWQLNTVALKSLQQKVQNVLSPPPKVSSLPANKVTETKAKAAKNLCTTLPCPYKCSSDYIADTTLIVNYAALDRSEKNTLLMSLMKAEPHSNTISYYIQHSKRGLVQVCKDMFCHCYYISPQKLLTLSKWKLSDVAMTTPRIDSNGRSFSLVPITEKEGRNSDASEQSHRAVVDEEEHILGL